MDNCKEFFLEDIIEISVYPITGCVFPIPFAIPNIAEMKKCKLSTPVLQIGTSANMLPPTEGSISAKCSQDIRPHGMLFSFDITATVENSADEIRQAYNNIGNNDHYICLRKRDDSLFFCYALPNTFLFKSPVTIQGTENRQVSISLKSNSEFIPITIDNEEV